MANKSGVFLKQIISVEKVSLLKNLSKKLKFTFLDVYFYQDFCNYGIAPKSNGKPENNSYYTDYQPSGYQSASSERILAGGSASNAGSGAGLNASKFGNPNNLRNDFNQASANARGGDIGEKALQDVFSLLSLLLVFAT